MTGDKPRLNVVTMPDRAAARDIPTALRKLADEIAAGDFGDAHNLVWIIDSGGGRLEFGLLGPAEAPGSQAHLLMSLAAHRILVGCSE